MTAIPYTPRRGDIYIAKLPNFPGQHAVRPCVIVSNDSGNRSSDNVIVVPVTSRQKKPIPTHANLAEGTALCEGITTIKKTNLLKWIGTCRGTDQAEELNKALSVAVGL